MNPQRLKETILKNKQHYEEERKKVKQFTEKFASRPPYYTKDEVQKITDQQTILPEEFETLERENGISDRLQRACDKKILLTDSCDDNGFHADFLTGLIDNINLLNFCPALYILSR